MAHQMVNVGLAFEKNCHPCFQSGRTVSILASNEQEAVCLRNYLVIVAGW